MKNYMVYDIGGSGTKWSIIDEVGNFIISGHESIPETVDVFFEKLIEVCNTNKDKYKLEGIAISAPGAVDVDSGIIEGISAILYIHGPNFKQIFKKTTGLDVEIENDANCAALGESWLGAGKESKDMAFVVCGSGIGGALIKDGKLHKGNNLHGGEFGYCILDIDDLADNPYLTWSRVGSTGALIRRYKSNSQNLNADITGEDIFSLAQNGDKIAQESIQSFYRYMAIGIYNIQYSYDPEVIVIGGAISERPDFLSGLKIAIDDIFALGAEGTIRPKVICSKYGNKANQLGAIKHFLDCR